MGLNPCGKSAGHTAWVRFRTGPSGLGRGSVLAPQAAVVIPALPKHVCGRKCGSPTSLPVSRPLAVRGRRRLRELEHRRFPFRTAAARGALRGCDGPAFPPPHCAVRGSARPAVLKAGLLPRLLPARCPAHDPPGPAKASLRLREPSAAHLSPILVCFVYSVSLLRGACMFTALVSS